MFDIGAVELLVIAVVAIIVVGPKDLPRMLRVAGQWVGKMKSMAREFQAQFDAAADEIGLDEIRDDIRKITDFDGDGEFTGPLDQAKDIGNSIKETIESPVKSTVKRASKPGPKSTKGAVRKKSAVKPAAKKSPAAKSSAKGRKPSAAAPASSK